MKKIPGYIISRSYKPIMDWWVAVIVYLVLIMLLVIFVANIFLLGSFFSKVLIALVIFILFLYVIDVAFFTRYRLDYSCLVIDNQLRSMIFPYRKITKMEKGGVGALWSYGSKKRFALSNKSVYVYLVGSHWKRISLSPELRSEFMEDLLHNIEIERASRASSLKGHKNIEQN